jgi:hypothetical protein
MRRWRGWAILPLLLSPATCREETRPALVADPVLPPPSEPDSLLDPEETPSPSTISSCGAATVKLEFVRPNLYFAIDASGSMTESIPSGEQGAFPRTPPLSRYAAMTLAVQTLLSRVGHRVNYGATLFPTVDASCDAGEEIQGLSPGDDVSFAVSGEVGPLLRAFLFRISRRSPGGATPVALALRGLVAELSLAGPDTYVFLLTDGGPNCNSDARCDVAECIPNIEGVRTSDGLRCGDEINCCDASLFGAENCLDRDGSREAVQMLAAAGVRTFVIGIPGSDTYAQLLDELALAGGVARSESPHYYRVADAEELTATVSSLGNTVALDCTIVLSSPPPNPALVNLFFDGELVPADPVDGWTFADDTTVAVTGAACELLRTGQVLQADVIAGCPVVVE